MNTRAQIFSWWLPLSILLVLTYCLQISLYLHADMLYLLYAAKRMLLGGSYATDFFETNPPLIMYLYMPALTISKWTGITILHIFRLYILCYCLITLSLCHALIESATISPLFRHVILFSLAIAVLFLPAHEFGQREHIFMLCTFPYIFAMILRLENKPLSASAGMAIGAYACIGIALKPFFLSLPLLLECYYLLQKRSLRASLRPETITIAIGLCCYMASALYLFPDYFHVILPIVSDLYFAGTALPLRDFFNNIYADYALACIAFMGLIYFFNMPNHFPVVSRVLFIALAGFSMAFCIPHACFYYHILPAFGTAYLLYSLHFTQIVAANYQLLVAKFSVNNLILKLGLLIFPLSVISLPIYAISYSIYKIHLSRYDVYANQLFNFFNEQPNSTYIYFSSSDDSILMSYYSNASYVGNYPAFWWELGLAAVKKTEQIKRDEAFLVAMIARNLADAQPRYVLMDTIVPATRSMRKSNYVDDFMQHGVFQKEWVNYHYQTTIGRFKIYEHNA